MGDMADFALDCRMDDIEHFYKHEHSSPSEQYEEGLVDEMGYMSEFPGGSYSSKPSGPGNCPNCSSHTVLREGKFGKFYGCIQFPQCKGSRNFK